MLHCPDHWKLIYLFPEEGSSLILLLLYPRTPPKQKMLSMYSLLLRTSTVTLLNEAHKDLQLMKISDL